jgi:hypothetical protein
MMIIAAARKEVHFNRKSKEEGKYDMKCSAVAAAGWLSESPAALVSGAQSDITISTDMEPYFIQILYIHVCRLSSSL